MTNINTENLPPEMQARIADIIQQAKANAIQPVGQQAPVAPPAAPVARPPSLMDHIIALRQEVAELRQQVHASSQVTEAVGNAVGSLYQMFHEQTEPTSYSSNFQETQPSINDDY
jgi:hypothetical protein